MLQPVRQGRAGGALPVAYAAIAGVLIAVGFAAWLHTGPASAAPGTSASTTTVTDSTPPVTDLTGAPVNPVSTTTTIPSQAPLVPMDPTAPRPYVDDTNCLSCHGDSNAGAVVNKQRSDHTTVTLYVDPKQLKDSVHRFDDCTTCHGTKPHDSNSPFTKLSQAEKCGSCHKYEYTQYINSVHGKPQVNGNSDPATCTDCHSPTGSPHNIQRVLDPNSSAYPKNIAQACGKCHNDPKLMNKYGIVEKVYDSYMNSFHGKVISLSGSAAGLQQLNTATCSNCHGSHNIAAVTDPNAPVAGMENLARTCEQCHPGAGTRFASGFLGHKGAELNHIPQVYWGEKFFWVLTRATLAMGVLLVITPFGRWGVDKARGRKRRGGHRAQAQEQKEEPAAEQDGAQTPEHKE